MRYEVLARHGRRVAPWIAAALVATALSACGFYQAPIKPPPGLLFSTYKAPLTTHYADTPTSGDVAKVSFTKTFYLHDIILTGMDFAWDDVSIAELAKEKGLNEVYYADYEFLWIAFVFAQFQINVYGK